MLRIHFTVEDVSAIRIADTPDALWEVLLSLHALQKTPRTRDFETWRRASRVRLPHSVHLLAALAPPVGYSADFLTPTAGIANVEAAVDILRHTPRRWLRADVAELARQRGSHGWMVSLADGDPEAVAALGDAVRDYHQMVLAPYWNQIRSHIEADRAARLQAVASGGMARLLADLHPQARWRPPVLELPYPVDQDLHLGGQGIVLLPSFFCFGQPITLKRSGEVPVLVLPVSRTSGWSGNRPDVAIPASDALGALLGRTRAAILRQLTRARTTSELASGVDISLASASQHATVLRQAGLIVTRRAGKSVHHQLTPLGADLLVAHPSTPRPVSGADGLPSRADKALAGLLAVTRHPATPARRR